jgi:hypothetical protein
MSCLLCGSGNEAEFTAEMLIHFCGLRNIDKPSVGLFPKLLVCLDCGASQFTVPESELALLALLECAGQKGASTRAAERGKKQLEPEGTVRSCVSVSPTIRS